MPSLVPLEAQILFCPSCHDSTMIQSEYSARLPYEDTGNAKSMSSNTFAINTVFAGCGGNCGKTYRPVNTGRLYQIHAQSQAPPAHGRKRAVLCGITYKGHKQSLDGCINDVMCMRKLLVERFRFPVSSILVLTGTDCSSQISEFFEIICMVYMVNFGS